MARGRPVRLILLIALVLGSASAGAAGMSVYNNRDDDKNAGSAAAAATTTTTTTSAFEGQTTTSTLLEQATMTVPGGTTSTAPESGTTPTTATGATTTTTARRAACGTGSAVVTFAARDLSTTSAGSTFTPTATVENKVSQPIEIDELEYEVVYPDANRSLTFSAAGPSIPPGGVTTFLADTLSTPRQFETARLVRFAYFTAGRKAECRVSI